LSPVEAAMGKRFPVLDAMLAQRDADPGGPLRSVSPIDGVDRFGAIALVLAAVIILPMVFDSAPKQAPPPVSVRIPAEEDAGFKPKVTPNVPAAPPEAAAAKPAAPEAPKPIEKPAPEKPAAPEPAPPIVEKPVVKAEPPKVAPKPAAATAEKARAEGALAGEQYYVQVGAFVDPGGVIEKLKAAKIPYYTEPVATKAGNVVRVRAGPFASREAAQKVLQQLKGLGFKPADVAARSSETGCTPSASIVRPSLIWVPMTREV